MVTHDQDEALAMASRIAVMDKGAVKQLATPSELYEKPNNRFVADFIGKVNMFDARVLSQKGRALACDAKGIGKVEIPTEKSCGGNVTIAVRPEKIELALRKPTEKGAIVAGATVRDVAYYGDWSEVVTELPDGTSVSINVQNDRREAGSNAKRGDKVWVYWQPEDSLILTE
jgi:ABC-type Fe3+/spermidine/putrescine transport system ATPase subunit